MIRIHRQWRVAPPFGQMLRIDPRRLDKVPEEQPRERHSASSNPLRKDPHKEKGQRLRPARMARRAGSQTPESQRDYIAVADDVPWIMAVSFPEEPWGDAEHQLLGVARKLADEMSGGVVLVRIGNRVTNADAAALGVDRLLLLPASIDGDILAHRLMSLTVRFSPAHIIFAEAGADADLARRVAIQLGDRPATGLQGLSRNEGILLEAGRDIQVTRPLPKILTLDADRFDPVGCGPLREARLVALDLSDAAETIRDLGAVVISQVDAPLSEARILVSAGDGVTDWDAFRDVAATLGGTIAGSRQVCDAGYLPRHRQVGASGTSVTAHCYLAFGISGAPQHLQGVQRCKHVIAVNTDLHAAMVKRADLAIIADAQAVMPALTRWIRGGGRG